LGKQLLCTLTISVLNFVFGYKILTDVINAANCIILYNVATCFNSLVVLRPLVHIKPKLQL